jgi:hypothetical protein
VVSCGHIFSGTAANLSVKYEEIVDLFRFQVPFVQLCHDGIDGCRQLDDLFEEIPFTHACIPDDTLQEVPDVIVEDRKLFKIFCNLLVWP